MIIRDAAEADLPAIVEIKRGVVIMGRHVAALSSRAKSRDPAEKP